MKALAALSACALLALSAPVFAQNASDNAKGLQQNGSSNGADPSHAKQPGASDAGAGVHSNMTEGRSSSDASTEKMGGAKDMQKGTGSTGSTSSGQ